MAAAGQRTRLRSETPAPHTVISADTNLFFAWLNRAHPAHERAAAWFGEKDSSRDFTVCELVLVELYGLFRNPAVLHQPLSGKDATAMVQRLRTHPRWNLIDYPGGLMDEVWRLASSHEFARRRIYDARLARTLRHHGVTEFATANAKDFEGFGFTRLWNPAASD
jgi:toxin-antitoxin system PIN domain toxin